ncbi:hypothetical protein KAU11_11950 [Candidatus Babeliales bacterium]|nr:hypothetical protein [Candidatus Babeliales bacterium]
MAEHSTLTGSSLHEPKGVATANDGQIYVANGAGSGAWEDSGGSSHGQMDVVSNATNIALTGTSLTIIANYIRVTGIWQAPTTTTNSGISYSTDVLIVPTTGTYRVEFWGSFKTPNSSITAFKFGINQTATSPSTLSANTMKRTSGASVAYGVAAAHTIIDLVANDELSLYVASDTTGNLLLEDAVLMVQLVHEN